MHTASSAKRTCSASASASEWTATVRMPSSRQARMTRRAISPRLAMRIFLNIGAAALRPSCTLKSFCPNSTGLPFSARISTMVPATSASISFISFIASTMQSVCPSRIALPTSTNGGASGRGRRGRTCRRTGDVTSTTSAGVVDGRERASPRARRAGRRRMPRDRRRRTRGATPPRDEADADAFVPRTRTRRRSPLEDVEQRSSACRGRRSCVADGSRAGSASVRREQLREAPSRRRVRV